MGRQPASCVVVCWSSDSSAVWMYERLRERHGVGPVTLLLLDELADPRIVWEHHIGQGASEVIIRMPGGRVLSSRSIKSALNRAMIAPLQAANRGHPDDRRYAAAELAAFALSWVMSLGDRVVNRPTATGLSGGYRFPEAWRVAASEVGLAAVPWVDESRRIVTGLRDYAIDDTTLLVIGGETDQEMVPTAVRKGIAELARRAGLDVMSVRFRHGASELEEAWQFVDASSHPDLTLGGEWGVAAVESLLL